MGSIAPGVIYEGTPWKIALDVEIGTTAKMIICLSSIDLDGLAVEEPEGRWNG